MYFTCILQNFNNNLLAVDDAWFNRYCQPEVEQTKKPLHPKNEPDLMAVSNKFGYRVMVELAMDIRDTCLP